MELANLQRALYLTLFLFGLLAWGYVVAIQITHPNWLDLPLTHINVIPLNLRVDVIGIVAFIIAAICFFLWQLTRKEKHTHQQRF